MDYKNTVLVTGGAGFIGAALSKKLLEQNVKVVGLDNLNDYYDVNLKLSRLEELQQIEGYIFEKGDLADAEFITQIFEKYIPTVVVNLGAQAGVRYSITNPKAYMDSNMTGFFNILEACRHSHDAGHSGVEHLVFASSSSVYGTNKKVPYSTADKVDNPVSLYAATKKSNELMAHAYAKLYNIPCTGLRFFTVYGPMGRPDMAYFGFTNKIVNGEKIQIFNHGDMKRDFTYIDDIVEGIMHVMNKIPELTEDGAPYHIYNIGNSSPEDLLYFVETLESKLKKVGVIPADRIIEKEFLPMQPGDVYQTFADTTELEHDFGFKPSTSLEDGLERFAAWYKKYYC